MIILREIKQCVCKTRRECYKKGQSKRIRRKLSESKTHKNEKITTQLKVELKNILENKTKRLRNKKKNMDQRIRK